MSTIDTLLKSVAPQAVAPDPGVVDADLARGRAALARRHRTHRRLAAAAGTLAAAAVAVTVIGTSGAAHRDGRAAGGAGVSRTVLTVRSAAGARPRTDARSRPSVELAAYTGTQLPGFTVARVPVGWHLSTSTADALLIARDGTTNDDADDFVDKLAVLTSSTDQHGLGPGTPVTVAGRPGRVHFSGGYLMLAYTSASGFGVDIQAPPSLHWGAAQITAFAEGVTVTRNAVHGHG